MFCPIKFASHRAGLHCEREKCAWWIKEMSLCSPELTDDWHCAGLTVAIKAIAMQYLDTPREDNPLTPFIKEEQYDADSTGGQPLKRGNSMML